MKSSATKSKVAKTEKKTGEKTEPEPAASIPDSNGSSSSPSPDDGELKSLIGEALIKDNVITRTQLDRALKIQRKLEQKKQLGEVLVDLGFATVQQIGDSIAAHGKDMRIGDMLVEQGFFSDDDLQTALKVQKENKKPIGEILVDLGFVNERALLLNLANQAQAPYIEPSFGMIDPEVLTGVSPDYLEHNRFVPFNENDDGTFTVVVSDLHEESVLNAVQDVYANNFVLALGPREAIQQTIQDFRKYRQRGVRDPDRVETDVEVGEGSVTQLVTHVITQAIEERASDIHIEPMSESIRLRYRIDGALVFKTELPKDLMPKLSSRIKILAQCDIAERQRHQGGRFLFEHKHKDYDVRLSTYVTVHGECIVMRLLNKQLGIVSLSALGMNPAMLERFKSDVLDLPTGVVLITGPTGSGKTTTMYSSLDYCNKMDRKIITAEDPVEFMIDGLIQCTMNPKQGRTFDDTLREIVRQDPDIIVLGEIRDRTSAETAIQAALTGHKVYSTFHTEDTIGSLVRLLNMEIEAFLISSTVISVVAQRLLRRICKQCEEPYVPSQVELAQLGLDAAELRENEFRKGKGCKNCAYTGYRDRVAVYELLVVNEAVKDSVNEKMSAHEIRRIGYETSGLLSMREDGISKVIRGTTTFEEVLRHTPRTYETRPLKQILTMTK